MACVVWSEAIGAEMVESYNECTNPFLQVGWWDFRIWFQSYNKGVVEAFSSLFDGKKAQVRDLEIVVDVDFITDATHLPIEGEKWSKNYEVHNIPWKKLLTDKYCVWHVKGLCANWNIVFSWVGLLWITSSGCKCGKRIPISFLFISFIHWDMENMSNKSLLLLRIRQFWFTVYFWTWLVEQLIYKLHVLKVKGVPLVL